MAAGSDPGKGIATVQGFMKKWTLQQCGSHLLKNSHYCARMERKFPGYDVYYTCI